MVLLALPVHRDPLRLPGRRQQQPGHDYPGGLRPGQRRLRAGRQRPPPPRRRAPRPAGPGFADRPAPRTARGRRRRRSRLNSAGDVAALSVVPTTSPQAPATERLVHRLRDEILPAATADTGLRGARRWGHRGSHRHERRRRRAAAGARRAEWSPCRSCCSSWCSAARPWRPRPQCMNVLSIAAAYGVVALVLEGGSRRRAGSASTARHRSRGSSPS